MNPYEILGVSKTASSIEIKKAYRKLVLLNHPDKFPPEQRNEIEKKFKEINKAYEILSDDNKRAQYDNPMPQGGFPGPMNDIMKHFFGQGSQFSKEPNIPCIEIIYEITLEEIYTGIQITKEYERLSPCLTCDNTGFQDNTRHICNTCNGYGKIKRSIQIAPHMIQQMNVQCTSCNGLCKDTKYPQCNRCEGLGLLKTKKKLIIDLPAGIKNKEMIIIENIGNYSVEVGKRGPVKLIIIEKEHPVYHRGFSIEGIKSSNSLDLLIEIEIELYEAICGFTKEFVFLDGEKVLVREENVVRDNSFKVLVGKGFKHPKKSYVIGNLYIKYSIKYPTNLSNKQKEMVYFGLTGNNLVYDDKVDNIHFTKELDEIKTDFDDNGASGEGHGQRVECAQQ